MRLQVASDPEWGLVSLADARDGVTIDVLTAEGREVDIRALSEFLVSRRALAAAGMGMGSFFLRRALLTSAEVKGLSLNARRLYDGICCSVEAFDEDAPLYGATYKPMARIGREFGVPDRSDVRAEAVSTLLDAGLIAHLGVARWYGRTAGRKPILYGLVAPPSIRRTVLGDRWGACVTEVVNALGGPDGV